MEHVNIQVEYTSQIKMSSKSSRLSSSKSIISKSTIGSRLSGSYSSSKRENSFNTAQSNLSIQSAKTAKLRQILESFNDNKQLYENYVLFVKSKSITSEDFALIIQNGQGKQLTDLYFCNDIAYILSNFRMCWFVNTKIF